MIKGWFIQNTSLKKNELLCLTVTQGRKERLGKNQLGGGGVICKRKQSFAKLRLLFLAISYYRADNLRIKER